MTSYAVTKKEILRLVKYESIMNDTFSFQLAFGLLRLGFITTYLSEPLIQAFTTGAALHVVTSQAPSIFGIRIQASSGIGSIFRVSL